jgi:hypothetical protein
VIIEGQDTDPAGRHPLKDRLDPIDIVRFVAQVQARIRAELRPQPFQRGKQIVRVLGAAEARLP